MRIKNFIKDETGGTFLGLVLFGIILLIVVALLFTYVLPELEGSMHDMANESIVSSASGSTPTQFADRLINFGYLGLTLFTAAYWTVVIFMWVTRRNTDVYEINK